jgi:hypothetical protein
MHAKQRWCHWQEECKRGDIDSENSYVVTLILPAAGRVPLCAFVSLRRVVSIAASDTPSMQWLLSSSASDSTMTRL